MKEYHLQQISNGWLLSAPKLTTMFYKTIVEVTDAILTMEAAKAREISPGFRAGGVQVDVEEFIHQNEPQQK